MNYGYKDGHGPKLSGEDEPNRVFIQLYHMNTRDIDLQGKEVLEVGVTAIIDCIIVQF